MRESFIPPIALQSAQALPSDLPEYPSPISVLESGAFYEIRSALPGIDVEDVIVGVADDVLTIGARVCFDTERTLGRFFCFDHRVTMVEQSFALPPDAEVRDLTTTFRDGVLSIFLKRTSASNVIPLFVR